MPSFAYQDFVDPIFERSVLYSRSKCISCCSEQVCCDLSCLWVGEEEKPQTDTQKDFQQGTASCSAMIRRIVESANPVCSLMER